MKKVILKNKVRGANFLLPKGQVAFLAQKGTDFSLVRIKLLDTVEFPVPTADIEFPTSRNIRKICKRIYEDTSSQCVVFEYINGFTREELEKMNVSWERCNGCECQSPSHKQECLVCGQETVFRFPLDELKGCAELFVWTLKNEKFKAKDILDRIERLKELALKCKKTIS